MALVTEVYRLTRTFPKEELYGLTSQMRRCAVSVPSNIAEGYGRNSTHDYVRWAEIPTSALKRQDSYPVPIAGRDSRRRGCEKGFSHQQWGRFTNFKRRWKSPGTSATPTQVLPSRLWNRHGKLNA
ncbi:MAG: four helix bundle protein [Phycisphaerae bacterium]|nr:four helix bundle protein [Phycisphaerae bacterium]